MEYFGLEREENSSMDYRAIHICLKEPLRMIEMIIKNGCWVRIYGELGADMEFAKMCKHCFKV